MKIHISSVAAMSAALFLVPAIAQGEQARDKQNPQNPAAACQVVRSDILLGAEARARSNDKIGSIKDIGVDTDTGRIAFFVVSSGGVLGIGDTEKVVGNKVVSCDPKDKQVVLDLSKEDFEKASAYDAKLLDEYYQRFTNVDGRHVHPKDASAHPEKPLPADRREATASFSGKVTSVDRKAAADGGCVVADVVDDKNQSHRVVLGPANFLRSQGIEPVVGDRVEVSAFEGTGPDNSRMLMASTVKGEKIPAAVQLRDSSGRAQWDRPCCVLASKLDGAKIKCHTEKVGSVGNLFCDLTHGSVAYVTLAKDFGDGDAIYLIPYRALWMDRDQALHLCATKEQMRTAPKLSSKEGTEVADPKFASRVNEFYSVESCTDLPGKAPKNQ